MKVFAIYREGVYRHECGGVFDTEEQALVAALHLSKEEKDDYHSWDIVPYEINNIYPVGCEPDFIKSV